MFRRVLALALLLVPGVAHAEWYEASTSHFVVLSNDKPERTKDFATRLERFDKALRFLRNLSDDALGKANRVTVFVVDDVAAVGRLAHNPSAAGFYWGRAGGSVAFIPRSANMEYLPQEYQDLVLSPLQILLHEYTHHFLLSLSPNVAYPGWFIEGYAEFFAPSEFLPDGGLAIGRPPQYRTWAVLNGSDMTVAKLLVSDTAKLSSDEREKMYGRGWLLTHYLFFADSRKGQLGAYFRALDAGSPPLEAAKVFGDLKKLDSELWTYKRLDFPGAKVPASALTIGEIALRKLTPAESATISVRIRSKAGVTPEQATSIYADAKRLCAPYPNDVAAQLALMEAAYDAHDYVAAEAAADRVLTTDPGSIDALIYKAGVKMALAEKANDKTPATWNAIRVIIGKANRLDPENPRPLRVFYETYVQSGQTPPKAAKDALYYAYVLAPQDIGLRFETAESYLRDGNVTEARALLMTFVANPHARGLADIATKMVAAIDAGHPDEALKELKKRDEDAKKPAAGKTGS